MNSLRGCPWWPRRRLDRETIPLLGHYAAGNCPLLETVRNCALRLNSRLASTGWEIRRGIARQDEITSSMPDDAGC